MTLVSRFHEVPLHIATSLRSSVSLLRILVDANPHATRVADIHGLTPLDWLWIRHVSDWCSPVQHGFVDPIRASMRRLIPNRNFPKWHQQTSMAFLGAAAVVVQQQEEQDDNDNDNHIPPPYGKILLETLWQRMRIILPAAAAAQTHEPLFKQGEPWSMVHASCFVKCPLLMVRFAIHKAVSSLCASSFSFSSSSSSNNSSSSSSRRKNIGGCYDKSAALAKIGATRDLRLNRLPLHYAASRPEGGAYSIRVSVGPPLQEMEEIHEESPIYEILSLCPGAVGAIDANLQLPLHIAIDAHKKCHHSNTYNRTNMQSSSLRAIQALLEEHPESIERRDGKTMLYPFQQAATSRSSSIDVIFFLLQQRPTLVTTSNSITSMKVE